MTTALPVIERPDETWEERIEYFRRNSHEFGVVFVGSSMVRVCFDPDVFDEVMHKHGVEVGEVFAIGVPNFEGHGIDYVLRRISDSVEGKIVLVDAYEPFPMTEPLRFTRWMKWHTPIETYWAIVGIQRFFTGNRAPAALEDKRRFIRGHLQAMADKYLLRGRFFENYEATAEAGEEDLAETQGHDPKVGHRPEIEPYLTGAELWDAVLEATVAAQREGADPRRLNLPMMESQVNLLREAGAERIFYIEFPTNYPTGGWMQRVREGYLELPDGEPGADVPVFFGYNNPAEHPSLFLLEERYDISHVNAEGSVRLTARMVHDMIGEIAPEKLDTTCAYCRDTGVE